MENNNALTTLQHALLYVHGQKTAAYEAGRMREYRSLQDAYWILFYALESVIQGRRPSRNSHIK